MRLKPILAAGAMAAATAFATVAPAPAQAQDNPFVSQMMLFGGTFCPRGWADASGQLLAIQSNQALFSLIGTTYGGDGRTTFGLPDLRGRAPISMGTGPGLPTYAWGQRGGSTTSSVTAANMPSHTHSGSIAASPLEGNTPQPVRNSFAASAAGKNVYLDGAPPINNMHRDTLRIQNTGGSQPFDKVSPYTTLRWCIALFGVYPSRT